MISAWKRLINKSDSAQNECTSSGPNGTPQGIQKLDKQLQRKFARGVNYNMKIVIKGDTRVGKTSLFMRLRGNPFEDNYAPTENLNVTSIDWSYKATDDIVKIDLWEAVDFGSKRNQVHYVDLKTAENQPHADSGGASASNGSQTKTTNMGTAAGGQQAGLTESRKISTNGGPTSPIPEADRRSLVELSENFDVYKGSDGVILMMDMTKSWTFKYVQNELPKIPRQIPVLLVANHRDQGHHRTVAPEQIRAFIDGLDRSPCDGIVMYTDASMKNGFGLKLIEKFFSIPFLKLQEATLLKQLELNRQDHLLTLEEIQMMQESSDRKYEQYLELKTIIRRQQADAMSPVNAGIKQLDEATRESIRNATMSSDMMMGMAGTANAKSIESTNHSKSNNSMTSTITNNISQLISSNNNNTAQAMASQKFKNDRLPSIVMGAKCPLPEAKNSQFNKSANNDASLAAAASATNNTGNSREQAADDGHYRDEDDDEEDDDSDEDEPRANPLVADYQSDLDSDDQERAA